MFKTVLAGQNLVLFLEQVEKQELKKLDNIAILSEDFISTLEMLLANNYEVKLVKINDNTIIEDKPLHVINIKQAKQS